MKTALNKENVVVFILVGVVLMCVEGKTKSSIDRGIKKKLIHNNLHYFISILFNK
ncbi:hypothetical protein MtrunA17_Chr7g0240981 [Medicago truncatula]|uniref:Uncharacterized protein n=1 Tax=Medicago truncatula TaxID=3880 RepID=A0A396GZ81_MEDTR|nr:hypothetical protein MtrunA17_Chr7g0240981 [Medicago truncatula]